MADIVPRRETSDMMTLRDAVDRLFQESFVRPWTSFFPSTSGRTEMTVDIYEEGDNIVVEASMPGVKPEDVDIRVMGDMLTIKGETKQEKDVKEKNYTYRERTYGSFQRAVTLPTAVNVDKAEAKMENGVLKLTLPKTEEQKARSIKIK